jgi:phage shock protein PspC (stress-responsive transcriptional regulator)
MKKNISINISGIIFHIEEDGYEVLKKYLDSINKYFSSFEDSSEILSDIESRIAEIFLSKLNEGKQVITFEDVNSLVSTMGSVSDFKAAEEQEFAQESTAHAEPQPEAERKQRTHTAAKQLHRDQTRKILGGVCAGLGNYFNVDAVWIRLLFALLTFGWGFGLLVYLIMWIAIPGSYTLEEVQASRKLFRDNERKVIGGVSGGLAAYFGFDIIVIRILFVITACFGFGLVAYIVLWIVLQPAVTITDKMEMQGEPVTLSNIESNLKKNFNLKEDEENVFVKILLFPFRLIGMILTGLGKLIYPLIEVLRVAIGVFITFFGLTLVVSVIITTGILVGLISGASVPIHIGVPFNEASLPIDAMSKAIPTLTIVAAFIGSILPGIMVTLLGISVIAKRIVFSTMVGWSMFVLFLASLLVLSFTVPKIVYSFKEDGETKTESVYPVPLNNKRIVLKVNEIGLDDYIRPRVNIRGYDGKDIKLVQIIESQGLSRQIAIENTKMVEYHVTVQDSIYTFDSNLQFKKDGVFRGQRAEVVVYVPFDYPFYIDEDFRIHQHYSYYTNGSEFQGNTWVISKETKDFKCVSCPVVEKSEEEEEIERISSLSDYDEVEISGFFDVTINQENGTHSVGIDGPDDEEKKYKITQLGNTLKIEYSGKKTFDLKDLSNLSLEETKITITLPELKGLKLKGAGEVEIENFNVDALDIEVFGPVTVLGNNLSADRLNVNLTGSAKLELIGNANSLDALVQGASTLKAFDFNVQNATLETTSASSAKVTVSGRLEMKEGISSKISYRGDPQEVIKE